MIFNRIGGRDVWSAVLLVGAAIVSARTGLGADLEPVTSERADGTVVKSSATVAAPNVPIPAPVKVTPQMLGGARVPTDQDRIAAEAHMQIQGAAISDARRRYQLDLASQYIQRLNETGEVAWVSAVAELNLSADDATPVFMRMFEHKNAEVRTHSTYIFGLTYPKAAQSIVDRLIQMLAGDDTWAQIRAAQVVESMGPNAARALPALTECLNAASAVRPSVALIKAHGAMGGHAKDAVESLRERLNDPSSEIAYWAFQSLGRILNDPIDDKVRQLLEQRNIKNTPENSWLWMTAVQQGKISRAVAVEQLHHWLAGSESRLEALPIHASDKPSEPPAQDVAAASLPAYLTAVLIETLGSIHAHDELSARHAFTLAANDDPFLSQVGVSAVESLAPGSEEVCKIAADRLIGQNPTAAIAAAYYLRDNREIAIRFREQIVAGLSTAIMHPHFHRLGAMLDLVRAFGRELPEAIPALVTMIPVDSPAYDGLALHQPDVVRRYLLVTFAELGTPVEAGRLIMDVLATSSHPADIGAACRAAARLPQAEQSQYIPMLIRPLRDTFIDEVFSFHKFDRVPDFRTPERNTTARVEAIRALEVIGKPAIEAARPLLQERAKDIDVLPGVAIQHQQLAQNVLERIE